MGVNLMYYRRIWHCFSHSLNCPVLPVNYYILFS